MAKDAFEGIGHARERARKDVETFPKKSGGWLFIALSLFLCCAVISARAEDYVPFRPDLPVGTKCLIDPEVLHPTQAAVGMREVELRTAKMRGWSAKKRERFMQEKTAPIVIGPGNEVYLLDHHHLARLLLESKLMPMMY